MTTPTAYHNAELASTAVRKGLAYQLGQIQTAGGAYYNDLSTAQIFGRIPTLTNAKAAGWPVAVILPANTKQVQGATHVKIKDRYFEVLFFTQSTPDSDPDLWIERMVADVESRLGIYDTMPRADGIPTCFEVDVLGDAPFTKLKDESYNGFSFVGVAITIGINFRQDRNDPSIPL